MLSTYVKINRITNLSDARYCAGMGVNCLGFSLEESSPHFMSMQAVNEIMGWVEGVQCVGEFGTTSTEQIREALMNYPLDMIEIAQPELLHEVATLGKPVILKMDLAEIDEALVNFAKDSIMFLHIVHHSNDPEYYEINDWSRKVPVILGFGVQPNTIDNLLSLTSIKGISLDGSDELRPGFQDYDRLADIFEALESE